MKKYVLRFTFKKRDDVKQITRPIFNSEAETLEKLGDHDQIPRLLAYFEEDEEFYLMEEFIDGHPLSVELPPGQRWTESQVMQLLQENLINSIICSQ